MNDSRRGVLYPDRLPEFHRLPAGPEIAHAVRWFWIPEWRLDEGEASRQEVLAFPACNLVASPDAVIVSGPTTRRSERVLTGTGWAVGALLRPAAVPALQIDPTGIRDAERPLREPELLAEIVRAMTAGGTADVTGGSGFADPDDARRTAAASALADWIAARVPVPEAHAEAGLANRLADALADSAIRRADQLPDRLHASLRTLQRIAARYFGLSLHSMIRRRRLQEGAERLRDDPGLTIAALASELGYADHAHFTTDFRAQLGFAPSVYRAKAEPGASAD